jgi:alpha-glucosidase
MPRIPLLLPLLLATSLTVWSKAPSHQKTPGAIDLKIGDASVELSAATPTAFRLSVSYDGKAAALPTCFLAGPAGTATAHWKTVTQGKSVGVATSAGELLIDRATGQWTLLDPKGATLIPLSSLPTLSASSTLNAPIAWTPSTPIQFYGCGNGVASLQQSSIPSHVANGVAVIPRYWSTAGYSVLAVGTDDNKPATANASSDHSSLVWHFDGKKGDLYLMPAASLAAASEAYDQLTGRPPVPPRWAFGYMQSRWGWKDRAYIEDTLHQFLDRKLPVDAFIFDFEWYTPEPDYHVPPEGFKNFPDFRWNPLLFPDPAAQLPDYLAQGVHFVGIRKPRLGDTDSLNMMHDKGWVLRGVSADDHAKFHARDMAFLNSDFRNWYADQSQPLLKNDIYGWWNDEGEGSFTTYYYWNLAELNAYATAKPGERLWTLNRAFSPGMQREGAACWTGDIQADWQTFANNPPGLLNWSIAGMTYAACDIGGFKGETNAELLTRWMEAGVFYPVFRTHSPIKSTPHFPWLFGSDAENAIRKAIDLRYRLIPYYYSLAHEAYETGVPLMRPLTMQFPDDPKCANISNQWLMGPGLMAAPILEQNSQTRSVYLPGDAWFRFGTATKLDGGQTIDVTAKLDETPVYVRAGTILPLGPVVQNTNLLPGGPLEVDVYPGHDATFALVEDDGETTAYTKGAVRRTTFKWNDNARSLTWNTEGPYKGPHDFHSLKIVVFDPNARTEPTSIPASIDGGGSTVIPAP